ncbi:MAG: 50S ribosomal protein L25 [bacterium]
MQVKHIALDAKSRKITGKKVKSLREQGLVPAVIYGHGSKPLPLEINSTDFTKAYQEAGTSTLVDLKIDNDSPIKVLTHEPQLNPVNSKAIHVDFYRVRMDEKIKTEIPLEFIGESDAVQNDDGTLVTNRDNIEIECLPNDLIPSYQIDISALKTFDDQLTVSDIKFPESIEILTEKEEVIASVERPRTEEELAELEESAAEEEKEAIEQIAGEEGEAVDGGNVNLNKEGSEETPDDKKDEVQKIETDNSAKDSKK